MTTLKQKSVINFKKAHSLLEKIIKMAEANEYCIDIMQQNLAVVGLLRSAHLMLMQGHFDSCFQNALKSRNLKKQKQMAEEIIKVTNLFNR